MKEFMYCFQIDEMRVFEVRFYTLSSNKTPYFATSAAQFIRSKRDYKQCGQAQKEILPKGSAAIRFYNKWNRLHLHDLTQEEYDAVTADIEGLKERYNYIEDVRECFGKSVGCYKTSIPFSQIVELSKMQPKWQSKKTA